MKPAGSFLLVCIFLCNMAGVPIAFKFQQMRIRREIKNQVLAGLPQEQLHYLSFSNAQNAGLQWTVKNREFRYEGEMYDIVSSRSSGDSMHYTCINDREEMTLLANLVKLLKKKLGDEGRSGKNLFAKLIRAITSLVCLPSDHNPSCFTLRPTRQYPNDHSSTIISAVLELTTPPPKQVPA